MMPKTNHKKWMQVLWATMKGRKGHIGPMFFVRAKHIESNERPALCLLFTVSRIHVNQFRIIPEYVSGVNGHAVEMRSHHSFGAAVTAH